LKETTVPVINLTKALINELPMNSGIWRDQQIKRLIVGNVAAICKIA
jgi:hypothetical protein